jgi:hypothetical protein
LFIVLKTKYKTKNWGQGFAEFATGNREVTLQGWVIGGLNLQKI